MRLSTDASRDEARSARVLRAAIEEGATLFDTADAYAWSDEERGHNERLIAAACAGIGVTIATKGGLTRPGGRWIPDGRAKHLRAACEASLRALGVERIGLYQLHAPDPRTPLTTSVRALAKLKQEGLAAEIGLCNVSVPQLRAALDLAPVRSVQIALSPFDEHAFRGGVPALCRARGLLLLAHSPLGGPKRARRLSSDRVLDAVAHKHGATPHQIVLAWLYDLGAIPLAGTTREDHAREIVRAASITLDEDDRAALDERWPLGRAVRDPESARRPRATAEGEVVLLMGMQGAGKSVLARRYVERGYARFNRDERGGTLGKLAGALDRALASGARRAVLDNTYPTRASRHEVIEVAQKHGLAVRCVWLDIPLHEAQINAVLRMLERCGRLLEPDELKRSKDPNLFDPRPQLRYVRELEPPEEDEGFVAVERMVFERERDPRLDREAVIVSLDAVLGVEGGDVIVDDRRAEVLRGLEVPVFATSWQPGAGPEEIAHAHERARSALGMPLEIATCSHPAGPPVCWCRKPMPGLALLLMHAHRIDPARSRWVGTSAADCTLARNVGFTYVEADAFFA